MLVNEYLLALMDKPSVDTSPCCCVCGNGKAGLERHHVVFRSQGGRDGPTLTLCGFGNTSGCHGLAHSHKLHFRYVDGWEFLKTDEAMKYENALKMGGWTEMIDWSDLYD